MAPLEARAVSVTELGQAAVIAGASILTVVAACLIVWFVAAGVWHALRTGGPADRLVAAALALAGLLMIAGSILIGVEGAP